MNRAFWLIPALIFSTALQAQEYCLALRGNGELMPSHWGAMANLVEKIGLPVGQAGGSSASITMMMNEAVASNKFVQNVTGAKRNQRAALLYKSFEGFADYLTTTAEWQDFITLFNRAKAAGGGDWMSRLKILFEQASKLNETEMRLFLVQNLELIKSNYKTGVNLGFISETNFAPLFKALSRLSSGEMATAAEDLATAKFYVDELRETIRVFGSFDAKTDANLFFRPGLVDFSRFGEQMGRMAQFYSAQGLDSADDSAWESFFEKCEGTNGMTWPEIASSVPHCVRRFQILVQTYVAKKVTENFSNRNAGEIIMSLPTTAVITGSDVQNVASAFKNYASERNASFGSKFFLDDPENLKFGYFGPPEILAKISENLPKGTDEKSRRFRPLGMATWKKVLGLSPAEPGLASLQMFEQNGQNLVSAGGWSDLHPVMVLRAAGCANVVYVTRRGGESPFAKGVAGRLLSQRQDDPKALELVSKLYDLDNVQSSMRQSIRQADAVLCTDWNRFEIKQGMKEMIRDAYRGSPYYVRSGSGLSAAPLLPQLNPRATGADGKLIYEGCF
jgi:hypothetical protein